MAKNKPSILDIAPAAQDKTRIGGLMEDIEVPGGQFADFDMMKEDLINKGFPAGLVNDVIEKLKNKDPQVANMIFELGKRWQAAFKKDPGLREKLMKGVRGQGSPGTDLEEDYPEDFGGDQGAF